MRLPSLVISTLLIASPVWADAKKAQSCAGALQPDSKIIFDESAPDVKAGGDIKLIVETKTRALVIGGKLARSSARPAAEAAGECLKMLKS
jgi:hypothetical protein